MCVLLFEHAQARAVCLVQASPVQGHLEMEHDKFFSDTASSSYPPRYALACRCYLAYGIVQESLYKIQPDGTAFGATAFVLAVQCGTNALLAALFCAASAAGEPVTLRHWLRRGTGRAMAPCSD